MKLLFVLLISYHTVFSDVFFRVGTYNNYKQCAEQGKTWTNKYYTGHYDCIPINGN